MPYYKLYNKGIYDLEVKWLLNKIIDEKSILNPNTRKCNNIHNISIICEIICGILSTIMDITNIPNKEITEELNIIGRKTYNSVVASILGYSSSFILDAVCEIRNTASHSLFK